MFDQTPCHLWISSTCCHNISRFHEEKYDRNLILIPYSQVLTSDRQISYFLPSMSCFYRHILPGQIQILLQLNLFPSTPTKYKYFYSYKGLPQVLSFHHKQNLGVHWYDSELFTFIWRHLCSNLFIACLFSVN